jgi:hypothetical protein
MTMRAYTLKRLRPDDSWRSSVGAASLPSPDISEMLLLLLRRARCLFRCAWKGVR